MSTGTAPQCFACRHYFSVTPPKGHTCAAFNNGIPGPIMVNAADHRMPYPGDHGIMFEEAPPRFMGRNGLRVFVEHEPR